MASPFYQGVIEKILVGISHTPDNLLSYSLSLSRSFSLTHTHTQCSPSLHNPMGIIAFEGQNVLFSNLSGDRL